MISLGSSRSSLALLFLAVALLGPAGACGVLVRADLVAGAAEDRALLEHRARVLQAPGRSIKRRCWLMP